MKQEEYRLVQSGKQGPVTSENPESGIHYRVLLATDGAAEEAEIAAEEL